MEIEQKATMGHLKLMYIVMCIFFLGSCTYFIINSVRIDNLQEEIDNIKNDGKIFNFNVECEGNDIMAKANYSTDSYELYKKMIKIYDTKNCKIFDALVSGDEQ